MSGRARFLTSLLFFSGVAAQWTPQRSGVTVSLRGISAVNDNVAWASGAKGTALRTVDGGVTWRQLRVPAAGDLDFRDIHAFDADTAILMSAGTGALSRIYKTSDAGVHWTLLLENRDEKGFFDGIAFWDRRRGLLLGDAVNGRMVVMRTSDGGASWQRVDPKNMPPANDGEGAFAASGTAVATGGGGRAWFATGGIGGGRVFRSRDWGESWEAAPTPIRHDGAASGIFSIAFMDNLHGIVTGGNYQAPSEDRDNVALTADGGRTWESRGESRPRGYRSAIVVVRDRRVALATGQSGTDISRDAGRSWSAFGNAGYHALSRGRGRAVWAVGAEGAIARWAGEYTGLARDGAVLPQYLDGAL